MAIGLQPIANIHTGASLGFEIVLSGCEKLGYKNIHSLYADFTDTGQLKALESGIQRKILDAYCRLDFFRDVKLFITLADPLMDHLADTSLGLYNSLSARGLPPASCCMAISELRGTQSRKELIHTLESLRKVGFKIVIDNFARGYSTFQLLYSIEPDFLKLDRDFIENIGSDSKKRLFVTNMINLAHSMSVLVIANDIRNMKEYFLCKDLGCDFVQGAFIHPVSTDTHSLKFSSDKIAAYSKSDRRDSSSEEKLITGHLCHIPPIRFDSSMMTVFDYFKKHKDQQFFPIVNSVEEPMGIVHEKDIKDWVYSQYGRSLLSNKSAGYSLSKFISKCPMVDIRTPINKVLELFNLSEDTTGVLVVNDLKYEGFLSTESLLKIIYERNLQSARDQNPLTKLPGNFKVNKYITNALENPEVNYALVYFDFNDFKPFNDNYGLRAGDRAILMFSEILKKNCNQGNPFIAHIGGDDFFTGFQGLEFNQVRKIVLTVLDTFKNEVESLYPKEDREKGYIIAEDRHGNRRQFFLLSCCAAVFQLTPDRQTDSMESIFRELARLKKLAKYSGEDGIYVKKVY